MLAEAAWVAVLDEGRFAPRDVLQHRLRFELSCKKATEGGGGLGRYPGTKYADLKILPVALGYFGFTPAALAIECFVVGAAWPTLSL